MNSTSIAKLLASVAAAAFLVITPVAAQESGGQGQAGQAAGQGGGETGGGTAAETSPGLAMTDEERRAMGTQFRAMTLEPVTEVGFDVTVGAVVPETVMLRPVPAEIVTAVPAVREHHFFALPDNRIAIVEPTNRRVMMVLD